MQEGKVMLAAGLVLRDPAKMCSFCGNSGHAVNFCYQKHGFAPNFRPRTSTGVVNNCLVEGEIDNANSVISHKEVCDDLTSFTPK